MKDEKGGGGFPGRNVFVAPQIDPVRMPKNLEKKGYIFVIFLLFFYPYYWRVLTKNLSIIR